MYESVEKQTRLSAKLQVPGDKSLSHRCLMFSALAQGRSVIRGLLNAADVASTRLCLERLGAEFEEVNGALLIQGLGMHGFKSPDSELNCGNSGTTMRLLMGLLAGQELRCRLTGDASLSQRPMRRIAEPLRQMGAQIGLREDNYAPIDISPARLQGFEYHLPVASAQLKSALLLAGLYSEGPVRLRGQIRSRDHTERLLPHFGVEVDSGDGFVGIRPGQKLQAAEFTVPGDPSTAAFWLTAGAIVEDAEVELTNVSLNPSRLGFVRVLQRMGADVQLHESAPGTEPAGSLRLRSTRLRGTHVVESEIPDLIDEVPLIAVLGAFASGRTEVRGATELRVKESDRLEAIAENLRRMGAQIELFEDGFGIEGPQPLTGAIIDPYHDHRIAMAFAIAGLGATGTTRIQDPGCVAISYPEFFTTLHGLKGNS